MDVRLSMGSTGLLTMKAPHCSFSARGNSLIVSMTWIFVSESISTAVSEGNLGPINGILEVLFQKKHTLSQTLHEQQHSEF